MVFTAVFCSYHSFNSATEPPQNTPVMRRICDMSGFLTLPLGLPCPAAPTAHIASLCDFAHSLVVYQGTTYQTGVYQSTHYQQLW